jgi:hypothetical protein
MTLNQVGHDPGPDLPAGYDQQPSQAHPLVLELIVAGTEPLAGTVGPAGGGLRVPFHGWIDLMAAISSLGGGYHAEPGWPGEDPGRSQP